VGLPVVRWSDSLLGQYLRGQGFKISDRTVGRILRSAVLQPHRQTMWLTSQDDEFREKRDEVLRVYYETRASEHIICLDEKTGIQALERLHPDLPMEPGRPVRREFEYTRHGTLCLMGAYDVRRGKLFGFTAESRGSDNFLALLDAVDTCYPEGCGHLVMDNLRDHDTDEVNDWFDEHPRWTRHFTPKHASWLNQIEIDFSILQRKLLTPNDFADLAALGIRTVIDLTPGDSRQEPALVQNAGMKFFRIAMVTTSRPNDEQIEAFLKLVNDHETGKFYVHCAGGRHRTGVMTAAYRITHDGWNFEQAFAEMRKFDFEGGWINHAALKSFVYDYYTQLKKPVSGVLATVAPIPTK